MKRKTLFTHTRTSTLTAAPARANRGFTIVELLIVVVVIAILAAITLVAYNGVTNRSKAAAAETAAKQAYTKVQTYAVTNAEQYPADLATAGVATNGSTTYQYRYDNGTSPASFCVTATTQNVSYYVSSATGSPAAGACPGHGANGVATVTNYATNPDSLGPSLPTAIYNVNGFQIRTIGSFNYTQGTATDGTTAATMLLGQPSDRWVISAGKEVFASVRARNANTSARLYSVSVRFFDSAGSSLGNTLSSASSAPTTIGANGGTETLSASGVAPSGTASVGVAITRNTTSGAATGDLLQVTNVWLSDANGNYASGNSAGWAWNGPANNSTSTGPSL